MLPGLSKEYTALSEVRIFEALQDHLIGDEDGSYESAPAQLDMKEGAVWVAVLRMRHAFACLPHREITTTVARSGDLEEKL